MQLREPHDLGEVLREVAEAAARDARDLDVRLPPAEHDGEVVLGDVALRSPGEIRDLATDDGARIDEAGGQTLHECGAGPPSPIQDAFEETRPHYLPVSVRSSSPLMKASTPSRA